jgi:hypothetical protein
MKKLLLALILSLLTGNSLAHNLGWFDADQLTGSSVLIRQVEAHSEFYGSGSGIYFAIEGDSNTISIDMQGDNSGCCNYVTGGWKSNSNSSLTILFDDNGVGHRVELDYDYTGTSNYHHMDISFDTSYYYQKLYFDDGDVDHSNTSFELDMGGGSTNTVYATIAGTQQAVKVNIDGGSNLVYVWTSGTGDLATGRTALYESSDASTYAIWVSVTGNNNTIRAKSVDTSKTKITLSGTGNHTISEYNDNDDWLINQNGGVIDLTIGGTSNNRIGYSGSGSGNTATITLNGNGQTSLTVDLDQSGGSNAFTLTVTGTTIHQYQPKFTQTGSYEYCATVNLNNLSASDTTTTTNASGGC